jgi:hypothetical protein
MIRAADPSTTSLRRRGYRGSLGKVLWKRLKIGQRLVKEWSMKVMSSETKRIYELGPFRLDTAEGILLRDGKPVSVTPKALEVRTTSTRIVGLRSPTSIVPGAAMPVCTM